MQTSWGKSYFYTLKTITVKYTPLITMKKYGLVILAAGGSSRLGSPKQLLPYRKDNLLNRIVSTALAVENVIAVVVIGAEKEAIKHTIAEAKILIVVNDNWASGMASSIKMGLTAVTKIDPAIQGCIFTVCDQPYITVSLLAELLTKHRNTNKAIIAAEYAGTYGTPVLIDKRYFDELMNLQKEEGAKKLLHKYMNDLATITFNGGEFDIDTKEDYKKLIDADR